MPYQNLAGTEDYLPERFEKGFSSEAFRSVQSTFREVSRLFGFDEIITPSIEGAELFKRSVGETSDIVQKEMFEFQDIGKREIALRPEGTASVIRSYVQNKLYAQPDEAIKLFYTGSMFRQERPQAGRQKEFTQLGCEAIGSESPALDAEVISFAYEFLKRLGISSFELQVNSIGCVCCREAYKKVLKERLLESKECLCENCQNRIERNPMRTLDCKNESCRSLSSSLPLISDYRCESCQKDFDELKSYLTLLSIPFTENPKLVRGLDYYEKAAFEFVETSIGAQSTICGGGRYNRLVSELGGEEKPGIGFAIGLERVLIVLKNQRLLQENTDKCDYYLIWTNEETKKEQMKIASALRKKGFRVEMDFLPRKMKSQLKTANRIGANFALILAESEFERGVIASKNLQTGEQIEITIDSILNS